MTICYRELVILASIQNDSHEISRSCNSRRNYCLKSGHQNDNMLQWI